MESHNLSSPGGQLISIDQIFQTLRLKWALILVIIFFAFLISFAFTYFSIKPVFIGKAYITPAIFDGAAVDSSEELISNFLIYSQDTAYIKKNCPGIVSLTLDDKDFPKNIKLPKYMILITYEGADQEQVKQCFALISDLVIAPNNANLEVKKAMVKLQIESVTREINILRKYADDESNKNFFSGDDKNQFLLWQYSNNYQALKLRYLALQSQIFELQKKLAAFSTTEAKLSKMIISENAHRPKAFKSFLFIFFSITILGIAAILIKQFFQVGLNNIKSNQAI